MRILMNAVKREMGLRNEHNLIIGNMQLYVGPELQDRSKAILRELSR
ncbi:MAG: hypothetical protein QME58_09365 [Bacteroidota bacterium]|nr:hypothetical protein [Bacteroidota bacterium]